MEGYETNFFWVSVLYLKFGGFWPPSNASDFTSKAYKAFQIASFTIVIIYHPIMIIIGILQKSKDFIQLIEALNMGVNLLLASVKTVFFWINSEDIKRITSAVEDSVYRYDIVEEFDPKLAVKKAEKFGSLLAIIFFSFGHLTIASAFYPGIALSLWYHFQGIPIANVSTFETLPYYIYVPIQYDASAPNYCIASIIQMVPIFLLANILIGVDSLFMSLLNMIATHLVIAQDVFRGMRRRCVRRIKGPELTSDGLHNSDELEMELMAEMGRAIQYLQMIFRSCNELEEIFRYITLTQALCSLLILCSTLLLFSREPTMDSFFYFMAVTVQFGMICWFGNEVTLKTEYLPNALWESEWLEMRRPLKICLLVTMMRLNKPLYLTAGKFAPLILSTHLGLMKASYSFYTVLKTTQ